MLQPILSLYPWRVWTDWGWQWQPRLTHGDLIDPDLFDGLGIATPSLDPAARATITTH